MSGEPEMDVIDALLEKPYRIIDILPRQVPADSPGRYFALEPVLVKDPGLVRKKLGLLLKLNCYYAMLAGPEGEKPREFSPAELEEWLGSRYLNVLLGGALLTADPEDTYMTLYGADEDLLSLTRALAAAEGLFLWE